MVPYRTIKSDFFQFDEEHYRAVGRRSHRSLRLGDPVRIRVTGTSLEQKLLDYELVEDMPTVEAAPEDAADNPEAEMERAMATHERRPRRRRSK
jgi:DNA-directed RNA polymerase subunit E'/Rpb7